MMVLYSEQLAPSLTDAVLSCLKRHGFLRFGTWIYNKPEDISVMNPIQQVPILVERDLILYRVEHHQ